MATCGKCQATGVDVAHVRACFSVSSRVPVPTAPRTPNYHRDHVAEYVPDSQYALQATDGSYVFYQVRRGKKDTRWAGFVFVDRLVGHPGDWAKYPVKGDSRIGVLRGLAVDPKAAAQAFSREHGVCACCGSPLSDPFSIANGLGPVCIQRFS